MEKEEIEDKVDDFVKEYMSKKAIFDNFCQSIESLCKTILRRNNIASYIIQSRTKDAESFKEKLLSVYSGERISLVEKILNPKNKKYKTWEDTCDLSGVRIIFAFEKDIYCFIKIIQSELENSIVEVKEKDQSGGYESIHVLVKLQDDRISLPEYEDFKGLTCEIQLRTLIDHAWSETSHKIKYKPDTLFQRFASQKAKDVIDRELKDIKEKYLRPAKSRLNALHEFYTGTNNGARILDDTELNILFNSLNNNEIYLKLIVLRESLSEKSLVLPPDFKVCELIDKTIVRVRNNELTANDHKLLTNVLSECLKVLELLRYQDISQALELLGGLKKFAEPKIEKQIEQVYQRIFKYDYHLLKRYGLAAQLLGLDYVYQNIDNLDIGQIIIIFSELLSPAFDGSQMKDENTLTWFSGPLVVSNDLKAIRKKSIDIIIDLASTAKGCKNKVQIIQVLDNALRFPQSGVYGNDFENMIAGDANYIIDKYDKLIFSKKNNIVLDLPVIQEIESQLNWITRRPIEVSKNNAKKVIAKLNKNEMYRISRLLTTSIRDYKGVKNLKQAESDRKSEIDKLFDGLAEDNIEKYSAIFNKVGEHLDRSNSWEWRGFSDLLCRIAEEKPKLAKFILKKSETISQKFLTEILKGFRKNKNWTDLDETVTRAIKTNNPKVIEQIFWSINLIEHSRVGCLVRTADLEFLKEAVTSEGRFATFMKIQSGNIDFHHSIIWALIAIYKFNPKRVENLISQEFENNKEFITNFLHVIEIGMIRKQIDLKGWNKKTLKVVFEHMVMVSNLDHDLQNVFIEVVRDQPDCALKLFIKRINKAINNPRNEDFTDRYEAIPDYFDEKLAELIRKDEQTIVTLKKLVENIVKNNNYLFSWKVGELVRKVGGDVQKTILEELVNSKLDDQLEAAVAILREFESPDVKLCFNIIENSSGPNSKVWNKVAARLYTTGVVSGEYGIKKHYESVLKQIKDIKKINSNSNVQQFANQMIKSFDASIAREDKRVKEDLILRKLEFEG